MTTEAWHKGTLTIEQADRQIRDWSDAAITRAVDRAPETLKKWELFTDDERLAWRARNEQARRQLEATRQAEKAAQEKHAAEALAAYHQQQIDAYKAQMQAHWIGTAEQFDAEWPAMLQMWQIEQARAQHDGMTARLRRTVEF